MRENRTYGLAGGEIELIDLPYPDQPVATPWLRHKQYTNFFGVLHTWGRDPIIYHPHVHFVVPCGGVSDDGKKWISTPSHFPFPEAVASPIYRQKFREILRAADLEKHVDPTVWRRWWEVNVKPVSDGRAVLKYLAPDVFRVAISDGCRL